MYSKKKKELQFYVFVSEEDTNIESNKVYNFLASIWTLYIYSLFLIFRVWSLVATTSPFLSFIFPHLFLLYTQLSSFPFVFPFSSLSHTTNFVCILSLTSIILYFGFDQFSENVIEISSYDFKDFALF